MAPNRMTAYNQARAAAGPQKGMTYSELLIDNILGLDNEYLSAGERLGQAINADELGFLKNAGISAYEGAKKAVTQPITTAEAMLSGLYDSGVDVASTLGSDPTYLNNALQDMFGVTYDEATDEQVNAAREALFGDVLNVASVVPVAGAVAKGTSALSKSAPVQRFVAEESGSLPLGPRGMGDNGGPAMQPQRYINPNTGMYSPSYEASKALKQEVGTPEQMRSMLLKAGAKEEELIYSGFDNWLKGKDKVTRQEIEDVLRVAAAGNEPSYDVYTGMKLPASNMPYAQRQYSASGITGTEGEDPYVLRRRLADDMQSQAIDERDARMMGELQDRGYRPVEFASEAEARAMLEKIRTAYDNAAPGGFMPDGGRVPPARVLNVLTSVVSLMDREGLDFSSPQVQRYLRGLTQDTDLLIGPSGMPEFSDDSIRRELPDERINPYFGSLSTEERLRISDQVEAMPEQEIADRLGIDVEDVLNAFDGGDTQYAPYVVPGMRNYKENLYVYEDAGRGVMAGLESLGAQTFKQPHFTRMGSSRSPIMFHTRTGELQTPEGPAYHLFEAQSDIAQTYRDRPGDFVAPGTQVQTPKVDKDQKAALSEYVDRGWDYQAAEQSMQENLQGLYDNFMSEDGQLMRNAPGYEDARLSVREARAEMDRLMERLLEIENANGDFFSTISDFYGAPTAAQHSSFQTPFDPEQFEKILRGRADPRKGYGLSDKTGALPFSSSTNRWLDAALKSELIKAAKSDAAWFTLPKGKDVARVVGGDELGQEKFYEQIAPQRLKKLAKDFLPGEVEIAPIKAKGYGSRTEEYDVLGMRLTPEIKRAILEGGFPSFAKGGPVQGSSLDVDVFALR
jgi:hypothetical protein